MLKVGIYTYFIKQRIGLWYIFINKVKIMKICIFGGFFSSISLAGSGSGCVCRIQIRIQAAIGIRIHTDPDPKHWQWLRLPFYLVPAIILLLVRTVLASQITKQ